MKTIRLNFRKINIFFGTLALITVCILLSACEGNFETITSKNTENAVNQKKYPTSIIKIAVDNPIFDKETEHIMRQVKAQAQKATTRAFEVDENGKPKKNQTFVATCYLINKQTSQLGKFNYTWRTSNNDAYVLEDPQSQSGPMNITVTWLKGQPTSSISGDDWKFCAIVGGTEKELSSSVGGETRHSIDFQPEMAEDRSPDTDGSNIRLATNSEPLAFVSPAKAVEYDMTQNTPRLHFRFNITGVLLQIKIKRDDEVSPTHDYFLKSNSLHPMGVFCPFRADGSIKGTNIDEWWESTSPKKVRNFSNNENYIVHLDASKSGYQVTENNDTYDVWYVWGMPTNISGAETMLGSWTGGYILKQEMNPNAQGPFISKHDFSKDKGAMRTLLAKVHDSEPYPAFNFLNFLSRAADHNVGAPRTWWDNDAVIESDKWLDTRFEFRGSDGSLWYSWDEAMLHKKVMPEENVWHTPSLTELTTLFPFPAEYGRWEDQGWDIFVGNHPDHENTFKDANELFKEWMTLYADLEDSEGAMFVRDLLPGNGGDLAEEQMKNSNTKAFWSHFLTIGKTTYAIRFFRSTVYGDRLCCAYKWETKNWPHALWTYENQLIVTSRWIGNAPLQISDISNDAWWNGNEKQYNVQVKLPCQGESTGTSYENKHSSMTMLAANTYQVKKRLWTGHFARAFSNEKDGQFQRKNVFQKGFIHPFCNRQMCIERGKKGDQLFEEGTGRGTGTQWPLPQTGWRRRDRR